MSTTEESVYIPSEQKEDILDIFEPKPTTTTPQVTTPTPEETNEIIIVEPKDIIIIEQPIKEEELPDFTDKTLTEVFLYIIKKHVEEKMDSKKYYTKIGIHLSKDVVEIINKIIDKNPSLLSEIENSVKEVVKDNKIDANDIPDFINIVQILYERLHNTKDLLLDNNKLSETCATILKFIVHTLVEERKIVIEEDKKPLFLAQFDKLIDSCIRLLNFNAYVPQLCCVIV